jgi:hypothetical protein
MPRVEDLLLARLSRDSYALWLDACRKGLRRCLAEGLVARIDFVAGKLAPDWAQEIDDLSRRNAIVVAGGAFEEHCIDFMVTEQWDELEQAAATISVKHRSKKDMRLKLQQIFPALQKCTATGSVIAEQPLPELWRVVADQIASKVHAQLSSVPALSEEDLHHHLLLAAYFTSCQLPVAVFAEKALQEHSRGMTSIRGGLVRIIENVGADGVKDALPARSARTGAITLQRSQLSNLLAATVRESAAIEHSQGLMHRILEPLPDQIGLTEQLATATGGRQAEARDAVYRLYEHTLLAYMALSCIEQLVRAWASSKGFSPVAAAKPRPIGLLDLIKHLTGGSPASGSALARVEDLYTQRGSNLRNRIAHGGLLDVSAKRMEVLLSFGDNARFPAAQWQGRDEYGPENISQLCCEALLQLDREVAAAGCVAPAHLDWMHSLWLTDEEIGFGLRLANDWAELATAQAWHRRVGDYLGAVAPATKHFFDIALHGWLGAPRPDGLVNMLALVLVFEAVYRTTVHLMGFKILQKDSSHVQYKMIDEKQLASDAVLNALVAPLATGDQVHARRVFGLAIKIRNAFAHGAFTQFTPQIAKGAGNLLIKSVQGLTDAGMRAMINVAAYYRWQNAGQGRHGDAVEDWLEAERQIYWEVEMRRN